MFIVVVVSFGRYHVVPLVPFLFYPFIITALAEVPYRILLPKLLVALPFCLFAGISNVVFDRQTAIVFFDIHISYGILSLLTILIKMYLCVMAALLLTATTSLPDLSAQLRRLHVPFIFVMILEMVYRYIGVLLEETRSMTIVYLLRSAGKRALEMRHMGSFVGQLLLRGFDRAERIYSAMLCRGYGYKKMPYAGRKFRMTDVVFLFAVCGFTMLFRFIQIG